VLHAIGMFGVDTLTEEEKIDGAERRAWFSVGEVTMAGILAGTIAVPAGFWFAGITALPLAVIGGAVLFLPLFVFLPRLIQYAMRADTDAVLDAFGKNEQVRKVFWTFFIATAGLVLAQVVDRLGANEAPHVAAWYVGSNRALYVSSKHCAELLSRDCEGLRTEWATRTRMTDTEARQADQHQAAYEAAEWVDANIESLRMAAGGNPNGH
jgi:hypothetical protein